MSDALGLGFGAPCPLAGNVPAGFRVAGLNASNIAIEYVFQAFEAATITKIGVCVGAVAGTSPVYRVSLQGVGTDGNPDGTIKGGGSPASATFTPVSSAGWTWITLANAYTCTRGEWLSIVIDYSSGTINSSNRCNFSVTINNPIAAVIPGYTLNTGGVRAKTNGLPLLGYASASKAYGFPATDQNTIAYASTSNPNEYAMKFTLPSWASTYQIAGVRFAWTIGAAGGMNISLYSGGNACDTTVLQSAAVDSDTPAPSADVSVYFTDTTLATLTAGGIYRIGFAPQNTVSQTIFYVAVAAAADWAGWPGGQNIGYSTRNGGNWTDTATRRLFAELIFGDATGAAAGIKSQRAMTGGF